MIEEHVKLVESIFWNDVGEDPERWHKAIKVLKAMPKDEARRILKEAKTRAEEPQSFYGLKDGIPGHEIKKNVGRIRETAWSAWAWIE